MPTLLYSFLIGAGLTMTFTVTDEKKPGFNQDSSVE
jgi:hypothetical protein